MTIQELLSYAKKVGASDIHYEEDKPVSVRIDGNIKKLSEEFSLMDPFSDLMPLMNEQEVLQFNEGHDVDFSMESDEGIRVRVNLFRKMGKIGCVFRLLADHIPTVKELGLPTLLEDLAMKPRGLVLVTGPTGSGKSTTLASMIGYANRNRPCHIITVEDPVEYVHTSDKALISQREVGRDTESFASALRSSLREDPDIIQVGEMRDFETISAALTAAETGHLVFSTLHTTGAAKTIDRIIDVFPPYQQGQVRSQLAGVLKAVVSQQLVRLESGGRKAALEIMIGTDSISNMIREGKTHQIDSNIQTGRKEGMILMDVSLGELVARGEINMEEALEHAVRPGEMQQYAGRAPMY